MHYILALLLASFAIYSVSCSVISKDEAEIEKIAEDVVEEIVEDLAKL
jgi:hypothetical protein